MTTTNVSRRNTRKLSRRFSLSKTCKKYSNIKNINTPSNVMVNDI